MGNEKIENVFFSSACIRTLRKLYQDVINPDKLHQLILEKFSKVEILRDKKIRTALINSLRPKVAYELAHKLGLESQQNNIYSILTKCSIPKNSQREKILFEFFEVDWEKYKDLSKLEDITIVNSDRPLFEHQIDAIEKIKKHLNSSKPRVLLHMPTGSGKTRTAMRIVSDFFLENKSALIIWLAHSEELTEQTIEEFQVAWKYTGNRDIPVYRFSRKNSPDLLTLDHNTGFIVAGLKKMNSAVMKNELFLTTLADRVTMVVMDEAHQAIADTYKFVLNHLVEKHNVKLLGLSATPGRTWNDKTKDAQLASFFYRNKVTLDVGKNPIIFLTENKFIAKQNIEKLDYNSKLTQKEIELVKNELEIPQSVLDTLAKDEKRNIKIIIRTEKLIEEGHKRIIIFATSISHARDLSIILHTRGYKSWYIDSTTSSNIRRKIIEEYKSDSKEPQIICNFRVLTTGFDAPKTSAVVITRPTKSLVLYNQMAGRAIRGIRVGGNKECVVVTVTDINLPGFNSLVDAFTNWDDVW